MMETRQYADFVPHLRQNFRITLDGSQPIDLELVSVQQVGATPVPVPGQRQPFSLEFLGPISNQYLLQHIYRLQHEDMGTLELFLVPLGPADGRMRYQAIIS